MKNNKNKLFFNSKCRMNAPVYLLDPEGPYCRTFRDLKEWLNVYEIPVSYSKKKECYFYKNKPMKLDELLEQVKYDFSFVSYEKFRVTDLLECCNERYSFENFLEHLEWKHSIEIFVGDSDEKFFCYECEFCSIKPEELQEHTKVHFLPENLHSADQLIPDEFYVCDICERYLDEQRTFHKENPLAMRLYIEHLNIHYKNTEHKISKSESDSSFSCNCGAFTGVNFDEILTHLEHRKNKIEVNPKSITLKTNPELRDSKCSICLDELEEIVYMCIRCKNGFCFHKCSTEIISKNETCPICRNVNF